MHQAQEGQVVQEGQEAYHLDHLVRVQQAQAARGTVMVGIDCQQCPVALRVLHPEQGQTDAVLNALPAQHSSVRRVRVLTVPLISRL